MKQNLSEYGTNFEQIQQNLMIFEQILEIFKQTLDKLKKSKQILSWPPNQIPDQSLFFTWT